MLDEGNDLRINLNKENLMGEGQALIRELLLILQTYKSSGAVDRAKAFYERYSKVKGIFRPRPSSWLTLSLWATT